MHVSRMAWVIFTASFLLGIPSLVDAAQESIPALKKLCIELMTDVMDVESFKKAAKVCEDILAQKENDLETMANLSRICWSLGNHETDHKLQKQWFKRGRDIAEKIKEIYPNQPHGYYWHGVNYGEWVDRSSIFVKIGAKSVIMNDMDRVLALNDLYDGGGAYIIIGRINYISPGGSYAKAIECYEHAINLGPRRTTAYLYLGELYLHEHLFEKARKLFQKVLEMDIDKRYAIEARDDQKAAKRLLNKLDKIDDHFPEQEALTSH